MASPQLYEEYDIIIAGGGTAAGVIFGRLAATDPSLRILMLEMGPTTKDDLAHVQPARTWRHLKPGSGTVKGVVGKPSVYLDGRELTVQCAQCVGGGSSVSFMGYTQPAASDYDDWAHVHNNSGWSFKDLLPLIKKAETYYVASDDPSHGHDGPLKVSYGGTKTSTNVGKEYITTITQYDKTRAIMDASASPPLNHVHHWAKWIDGKTSRRSDVAHNYIYPALDRSQNVHLLPGCTVRKVIIEDGKATGVEYLLTLSGADSTPNIVRATKLVVLSSGTFGSPAIMERSGVGSKDILERNRIKQVVDLPGVGENFIDHPCVLVPFCAKEDAETLCGIIRGDQGEHDKWSAKWKEDGEGLMGSNGLDAVLRYRPSEQEVHKIGPKFVERWASFYAGAPDKPIIVAGLLSGYLGSSPPPANQKVYCPAAFVAHPVGSGSVHITSAKNIDSPLDFDTGILTRKEDLAALRHAWKICREYGRRMPSCRGENTPDYPKFPAGSAAASPDHNTPVATDAPDIEYTEEDDRAIDNFLKANVLTAWNSSGTCAMKSRDKGGVVDSRLNVYGVQNLKVADMSICPSVMGSHTGSVAVLVGEKAAVIIGEELAIANV